MLTVFVAMLICNVVISVCDANVYHCPTFAVVFHIYAKFVLGASGNGLGATSKMNLSVVSLYNIILPLSPTVGEIVTSARLRRLSGYVCASSVSNHPFCVICSDSILSTRLFKSIIGCCVLMSIV